MIARLLVLMGLCLLGASSMAQGVRTVNGRKFMVHTVREGQTLYAISRSFAVPVDELLASNPATAFGLSIGQELLVPLDAVQRKELKTAPLLRADGELIHTVRKKETLFGIARSYGLEVNDLLDRNPEAIALQEDMMLVIPTAKVTGSSPVSMLPAVPDGVVLHRVQQGETLFSLSKQYNVEVGSIEAANGGLLEGLKTGSDVRIPVPKVPGMDSTAAFSDAPKQRYHVAFLLPFSADQNDSALAQASINEEARYYEPTRIAVQFYNGALLAIDSMQRMGLNADISVLDMGDDPKTWNAVAGMPEMKEMDLFIGPFHRTAIDKLARTKVKAHIVCPVPQSSKVILGLPNVSKVTPTRSEMVQQTVRYVAHKHAMDNIILVRPDIASEADLQLQYSKALNTAMSAQTTRLRDSVLVVRPGRKDMSALTGKLDATKLNVLVVPSEDVEFVTSLMVKLKPLVEKYRILLVGMEQWTTFQSVAAADLDLLGFTFASGSFTDRSDPKVKEFVKQFRDTYNTDADEYAFLGFDITFFYLKALMTQGPGFAKYFDLVHTEPLHMGFRMSSTGPENGYRNEHAIMLQQKDLKLQKAP